MNEIAAYRQRTSKHDESVLLGQLCWFGVGGDVRVPHEEFVNIVVQSGSNDPVPKAPKAHDTFRRVVTGVKRQRVPTSDPDVWESYRTVEFSDDSSITRRVLRDRVDNAGRKIGHDALFDVDFDRVAETLKIFPIDGFTFTPNTEPERIRDEILATYDDEKGCLYDQAIRDWIRGGILRRRATMVKRGVYFLRQMHVPTLESIEKVADGVNDLIGENAVEIHYLGLIDDRKQRGMVQKAYEAETIGAVEEMLFTMAEIMQKDKKISADRYSQMLGQFHELTAKTEEYEHLLEQKLHATQSRLDMFKDSLFKLRKNVKETTGGK